MKEDSIIVEAASALLIECREDEVAFSEVLRTAKKIAAPSDLEQAISSLIQTLLGDPEVRVGQWHPSEMKFIAWTGDTAHLTNLLISEWKALCGEPKPGDIAWFSAVDAREIPYEETFPPAI